MNILEKYSNQYSSQLTTNDYEVIQQIYAQYSKIPDMTIKELAVNCYSSPSTIHRVIKKLGFKGFPDFKYRITDEIKHVSVPSFDDEEYVQKIVNDIQLTKRLNEKEIIQIAKVILSKKKKFCFGTGWKQKQIIDNFSVDLLYYDEAFTTFRTINDMKIAASNMDTDSLILIVSLSGNAETYLETLKTCLLKNITIVSITADTPNTLSSLAHYSLYYKEDIMDNDKKHWNTNTLSFLSDYLIETIVNQKYTNYS